MHLKIGENKIMSANLKILKQFFQDMQKRPFLDIVRGGFTWLSVIMASIFFATLILILFPIVYLIDKERHTLHNFANGWGKAIQYLNPWWNFNIIGRENLAKKNEPAIYVANHQSQADILALFIISTRFRWLSKASLFKIPLFGWAMSAVGYVPVIRGNKRSSEQCMRTAVKHLRKGTPMVFFPEGTRSKTGELGQFKNGAFRLAASLGIPIVPITINGCTELLPKGSFLPKSANVTIYIHKPICPKNFSAEELMLKAREIIEKQLVDLTNEKG